MEEALLKQAGRRVGGHQAGARAVEGGAGPTRVFLGKDADGFIYHRLNALCEERHVPVTVVDSMQELGKLCQVDVKGGVRRRAQVRRGIPHSTIKTPGLRRFL